MATAYGNREQAMDELTHHYWEVVKYLGWEGFATVLAIGCGSRSSIERSAFPELAYRFGQSV